MGYMGIGLRHLHGGILKRDCHGEGTCSEAPPNGITPILTGAIA